MTMTFWCNTKILEERGITIQELTDTFKTLQSSMNRNASELRYFGYLNSHIGNVDEKDNGRDMKITPIIYKNDDDKRDM